MGIKIPKVPQEVPVAKAKSAAMAKMIAGRKFSRLPALFSTILATYSAAPSESVIALRVHARDKIVMAGTIALNPSGIHSMQALYPSTLRPK